MILSLPFGSARGRTTALLAITVALGLVSCRTAGRSAAKEQVSGPPTPGLPNSFHDNRYDVDVYPNTPNSGYIIWVPEDRDLTKDEVKQAGNILRADFNNPDQNASRRYWSGYDGDHLLAEMGQNTGPKPAGLWYMPLGTKSELLITDGSGSDPVHLLYNPDTYRFDNHAEVTIKRLDFARTPYTMVKDSYGGQANDQFAAEGTGSGAPFDADERVTGTYANGQLVDGDARYTVLSAAYRGSGAFIGGKKTGLHSITYTRSKNTYQFVYDNGALKSVAIDKLVNATGANREKLVHQILLANNGVHTGPVVLPKAVPGGDDEMRDSNKAGGGSSDAHSQDTGKR